MISNKWEPMRLGDILNFRRGHDLPKKKMKEGNYPVVGSNGVIGYHNDYTTESPCITIGRSGNVGKPHIVYEKAWAHNTTLYIDNFKGNSPEFIYYFLKTLDLGYYAGGSAVPTLNRNHIHPIEVNVPVNVEEQKKIANILLTLDEKIETNNQINEKLEEMAQVLFKHWFVDFEFPNENGEPYKSSDGEMVESELGVIPKGWKTAKLEDIIDNIKESAKPGEHLKNKKYLPIDVLPMRSITVTDYKSYKEAKSSLILFDKYDILIGAMRVYFHRVNLAPFQGVTRTTTFVLRPKVKYDLLFSLFLLYQDETISYANQSSKGSTIPYAVWDGGLCKMPIILPPENLRHKFNEKLFPFINQMINQSEENRKLKKIRDILLPKLMSGEIRVPLEENLVDQFQE